MRIELLNRGSAMEPATLTVTDIQVNGFTVGGGCTAPFVDGGNGPVLSVLAYAFAANFSHCAGTISLSIADPFEGTAPTSCAFITPGQREFQPIAQPVYCVANRRWNFGALPLVRGALLVRCMR